MLLRVQHVDGTLDPPVTVDDSWLLERTGTSFFLPGRGLVLVIGHEYDEEGALKYAIIGQIPERRAYSATGHEAYARSPNECWRDSPWYGELMLDGSPIDVGGPADEAELVWSSDGRYLGAAIVASVADRATGVVVIDAEVRAVIAGSDPRPGLAKPTQFVGRALCYSHTGAKSDPLLLAF